MNQRGLIENEIIRFKRKGLFGIVTAVIIAGIYITGAPKFWKIFWPAILSIRDELGWQNWIFMVALTTLWHAFWVLFSNLTMILVYSLELRFFEQFKINPNPWPWHKKGEELTNWKTLRNKSIMNTVMNGFITLPLIQSVGMLASNLELPFSTQPCDMPDWRFFALNIIFCMYCEDMLYHWTHRILHYPFIYQRIHKVHHQFADTVGLATEYTHPLDYFFTGVIPSALACAVLGNHMHLTTVLSFTFLRVWETLDLHCGYEMPWSPFRILPFASSAEYHDFHHSHNAGNYSSMFSIWDTIYGKNKAFFAFISEKENKVD